MRRGLRIAGSILAGLACVGLAGALYCCSAVGLPEVKGLASKAPAEGIHGQIAGVSEVRGLFPALDASVGKKGHEHYASQIGRMLNTQVQRNNLQRHWHELRIAAYIRAHFSRDQRRTLLLNLAYFGDEQHGIIAAAQHFYQQAPSQLDAAQAAMLTGSLQRPSYFSPSKHPDRALQRRNLVLDDMVAEGTLTTLQAEAAKSQPLLPSR